MPDYAVLCLDHKCGDCCRCINDTLSTALKRIADGHVIRPTDPVDAKEFECCGYCGGEDGTHLEECPTRIARIALARTRQCTLCLGDRQLYGGIAAGWVKCPECNQ